MLSSRPISRIIVIVVVIIAALENMLASITVVIAAMLQINDLLTLFNFFVFLLAVRLPRNRDRRLIQRFG